MTNVKAGYHDLIEDFYEQSAHIGGIVLVNEGALVASALSQNYDSETIGTITSSTKEIIENNLQVFSKTNIRQILIKGKENIVLLQHIKDSWILVVFADNACKVKELMQLVGKTVKQIVKAMGGE